MDKRRIRAVILAIFAVMLVAGCEHPVVTPSPENSDPVTATPTATPSLSPSPTPSYTPTATPSRTPSPTATATITATMTTTPACIASWIARYDIKTEFQAAPDNGIVKVHVWDNPGLDAHIRQDIVIADSFWGTAAPAHMDGYTWAHTSSGWIMLEPYFEQSQTQYVYCEGQTLFTPTPESIMDTVRTWRVIVDKLFIRPICSRVPSAVGTLYRGDTVETIGASVVGEGYVWYRTTDGRCVAHGYSDGTEYLERLR